MAAYYNEHDPYAAAWLRNLIAAGHIAPGEVDERPIQQVGSWELGGFTQCHFFAGIGVWSYALRRAGWPDDKPIWTGSCPCQPFSQAGKQKGFADDRHLWPVWRELVRECRPPIVVGEQVASALDWLDLVSADMEAAGYAFGASDLCAAGFEGAHIRQRLYFVGVAQSDYAERRADYTGRHDCGGPDARRQEGAGHAEGCGEPGRVADDDDARSQGWRLRGGSPDQRAVGPAGMAGGLADPGEQDRSGRGVYGPGEGIGPSARATCERSAGLCEDRVADAPLLGRTPVDWLYCRDAKWRPVEPGTFPLVDAAPARVGRLRAYGNALDAETATAFLTAVRQCVG